MTSKPSNAPAPISQDSAPFQPSSPASELPVEAQHDSSLDMPHERDQQPNTAAEPDPMIVQAKKDLDAGLMDTELRTKPGIDAENRPDNLTQRPKL